MFFDYHRLNWDSFRLSAQSIARRLPTRSFPLKKHVKTTNSVKKIDVDYLVSMLWVKIHLKTYWHLAISWKRQEQNKELNIWMPLASGLIGARTQSWFETSVIVLNEEQQSCTVTSRSEVKVRKSQRLTTPTFVAELAPEARLASVAGTFSWNRITSWIPAVGRTFSVAVVSVKRRWTR